MSTLARDSSGHALWGGRRIDELLNEAGVGTPAYLYDLSAIFAGAQQLKQALGDREHLIAYAVKANGAGSIVRTLAKAGIGACLVSGAELEVALGCGISPDQMVINGVAKGDWEIDLAVSHGLYAIQAESLEEIERIAARARTLGKRARVGLRINPSVVIDSHSHISTGHDEAKFGIPKADAEAAFARIDRAPSLVAVGVSTHVGSMLSTPSGYLESATVVAELAAQRLAAGGSLEYINFGGGFGINDGSKEATPPASFARAAIDLAKDHGLDRLRLVVEPGRSLFGPYGVLVASVRQVKEGLERRWMMVDAGMNDLLRPALYGARHRIEPLEHPAGAKAWRVVGPICESSDDFGTHELGDPPGHVVIRDTGAYGFAMASEYNGRALPSEIFVESGKVTRTSASPGIDAWVRRRLLA